MEGSTIPFLPASHDEGRLFLDWGWVTNYEFQSIDIAIFFTLLVLEGALSFDNAAILAAMVRRLPESQRRRALLYGLGGAYFFRVIAIIGVSIIIANPWLKLLGGGYLLYLMGKHVFDKTPHSHDATPGIATKNFLGLTPFWNVVLLVELADIAFALDQVLAAVGLVADQSGTSGDKRLLIVLASMVAILFLRLSAYYITKLIDWFPRLETLAYVAVGWVGFKLVTTEILIATRHPEWIIPKAVSVGVTMILIVVPVVVKATLDLWRKRRKRVPA